MMSLYPQDNTLIPAANQGATRIFGNDESTPFSPTNASAKKIRVVSTFEFDPT